VKFYPVLSISKYGFVPDKPGIRETNGIRLLKNRMAPKRRIYNLTLGAITLQHGYLITYRIRPLPGISYSVPRRLGSRASLSPSPTILNANIVNIRAKPGANEIIGRSSRYCWPSFIILPQDGVGGEMPIPR
jgi:hypothetical protein